MNPSTLENTVRKAVEDGDAMFADLVKALKGVSTLGQKLKEFRDETNLNFVGLRTEMNDRFAQVDHRFAQLDGQITALRGEMVDEFSAVRASMTDIRDDTLTLDRKVGAVDGKVHMIIEHFGITEK